MQVSADTIAAIATAPGKGGVGIVRLSGTRAYEIGQIIAGQIEQARFAEYRPFKNHDGDILDYGIAIYFKAPHSYTGEDVFELQGHGGPIVLNLILKEAVRLGARLARPGEFTERAFINEKMDLAQAEAVADLIESTTEQAARAASRSLQGAFSQRIDDLLESLIYIRMYIEAALDFPEEEIDFLSDTQLHQRMRRLQADMQNVMQTVRQGQLLREGMTVVILGQPNAGKSSLLNALSGSDTAIVTDIAGTTRDVLQQQIHIDGLPLNIVDTAGLRETTDVVEAEGVKRAWKAVENADRILLLVDANKGISEDDQKIIDQIPENTDYDILFNKIDLTNDNPHIEHNGYQHRLYLSAAQNLGIDLLVDHLKQAVGYEVDNEGLITARQRHITALSKAQNYIDQSSIQLDNGQGELAAEDLRLAQDQLSSITGEFSSDDLLGEIFSSFCIGK